mgnify:CR=1 FL=1
MATSRSTVKERQTFVTQLIANVHGYGLHKVVVLPAGMPPMTELAKAMALHNPTAVGLDQ